MSDDRYSIPGYNNHNLQSLHVEKLSIKKDGECLNASICFTSIPAVAINVSLSEEYLHQEEFDYFNTVKHEKRKRSYLLGRCSAKHAIMAFVGEKDPKKILIKPGVLGQPVVRYANKQDIQVSITHCDSVGAAISFSEDLPMGIDIEKANPDKIPVLENKVTSEEKEKFQSAACSYNAVACSYSSVLTIMWTAKEALSKVLKTGLTTPFTLFEISDIEVDEHYITSYFKNFGQYKAVSFDLGNYICSIVYPKNTQFDFDVSALKQKTRF